eukprot:TRINITY_DN54462_c0_g1_i1.p1 TRINITY_DN54462_c0_g1~~TRINITY_DN54462_c0_g1_i1.p1  ORF type:complete len:266 (-),score=30.55 TRINITY_DN54462_c0_g1_i1:72-770(-)
MSKSTKQNRAPQTTVRRLAPKLKKPVKSSASRTTVGRGHFNTTMRTEKDFQYFSRKSGHPNKLKSQTWNSTKNNNKWRGLSMRNTPAKRSASSVPIRNNLLRRQQGKKLSPSGRSKPNTTQRFTRAPVHRRPAAGSRRIIAGAQARVRQSGNRLNNAPVRKSAQKSTWKKQRQQQAGGKQKTWTSPKTTGFKLRQKKRPQSTNKTTPVKLMNSKQKKRLASKLDNQLSKYFQ